MNQNNNIKMMTNFDNIEMKQKTTHLNFFILTFHWQCETFGLDTTFSNGKLFH